MSVELVPVEQIRAGDWVALEGPGDRLRQVADVEVYDTLGADQVEGFVVVYHTGGAGQAWENRAALKGVTAGFAREFSSLAPCRRGELVKAVRQGGNPPAEEHTMAVATARPLNGNAAHAEDSPSTNAQSIEMLPLAAIAPAPDNPRRDLGDVTELAASMGELGMLQPLVVTPRDDCYMVVCGHRRYAAAAAAKLELVPTIVRELTEPQRIKAMLIENCQREDLAPLEEARAYQALVELGMSQRQIAGDVGKTQSHISKRCALLELPAKAQAELDSGGITIDDARELLKLKEMPKRLEAALKEGKRYNHVARAVSGELRDHERAEKVGAATQQLKQKGVKLVTLGSNSYDPVPKGMGRVRKGGYSYYGVEINMDPAKHAKDPCHAAGVTADGEIVYVCTKPANHKKGGTSAASVDDRAEKAKERQREQAKALRARAKNIELGRALEKKLAAPKIDAHNMGLIVDLLLRGEFGTQLALKGLRYVDEDSQTVVKRKDESVSRIQHANETTEARAILTKRLQAAKTPEEIMGVVLQALIAAKLADTNAVPQSQRHGYIPALDSGYGLNASSGQTITKLAAPFKPKAAAAAEAA